MKTVTVIGIGGGIGRTGDDEPLGELFGEPALRALAEAALVVGGRRHLAAVAELIPPGTATVELGPLPAGLAAISGSPGPVVVLASGDPGWFGIVRTLAAGTGYELRVLPAPSSLSRLAAALGQPWDHVVTCSAHGRDPRPAINAARALPAVAVLTGPGLSVGELAAALDGWPRQFAVGERLGHPDQRVTSCPAAEAAARAWAEPNLVLVTDPAAGPGGVPPPGARGCAAAGWARPEIEYEHRDSMITKAEVRALAVARLGPAVGQLIWDIGAGSGSVGIECAGHGAAVVAVEADRPAAERIERNALRHRVRVRVVVGQAPAVLAGLPAPDAVFVGGGGPPVVEAVSALRVPRIVVACAAIDHALAARAILRAAGYPVAGTQLAASRFAELPDGSVRLAALNPTILLSAVARSGIAGSDSSGGRS